MEHTLKNSHPNTCSVTWETTNRCNFTCWYCPDHLHSGTSSWPDLDVSSRYFRFLREKHSNVFLDFIGGEPTLWPALPEFLENLPDGIDCEITTNGSRTIKWWQRVGPRLRRVTISHHFASASDDHLLDVAKILDSYLELNVLLLLDPLYSDRVRKLQDILKRLDISFETKPIFPKFNGTMLDYSEESFELLTTNHRSKKQYFPDCKLKTVWLDDKKMRAQDIIIEGRNKFKGWQCLAGRNRLHIDFSGMIWAGSCRSVAIGKMSEFPFLQDPIICNKDSCNCVDDVKVEKWKKIEA